MNKKLRLGNTHLRLGQVFAVPLLNGGFAFGYVTGFRERSWMVVSIFSCFSETSDPPADLFERDVAIADMFIGGANFELGPSRKKPDFCWRLLDIFIEGDVRPQTRYYLMGIGPGGYKRTDVLGEEPDAPISAEEAASLTRISLGHSAVDTARVEIAVKGLDTDDVEMAEVWLASHDG